MRATLQFPRFAEKMCQLTGEVGTDGSVMCL